MKDSETEAKSLKREGTILKVISLKDSPKVRTEVAKTDYKMSETTVTIPEFSEYSPQTDFWDYQEFHAGMNQNAPFCKMLARPNRKKKEKEKKECDRPCIRLVFKPLGTFAKFFGLFPCYDLTFVEKLDEKGMRLVHVLDYMYSMLVCSIMTSGAALCFFHSPTILEKMKHGSEDTDYWVISAIFYMTVCIGVSALFIFPKSNRFIINYLNHFAHIDKILCFDGRFARAERNFARRLLIYLIIILVFTIFSWFSLFILDIPSNMSQGCVDYLMVLIVSLAVMVHIIPTALFVFFVNSIRIRLVQFNDKVKVIIAPITPSCFACKSFQDYGKEIDERLEKKSDELAFTLEKMRILHGELTQLVSETGDLFGGHLIRDFIYSLCGIILYSYFLLFLREDQGDFWFIYIILDVFVAAKLVTICVFGDTIKSEALSLLKLLNKASTLRVSPECVIQIQMFIKKLDSPMEITASKYFTIDKRLLTAIMGSVTTYFIILVQFKLQDLSAEYESLKSCNFSTQTLLDVLAEGRG